MYLSCFLIDVGTDPDHPRPGRHWLRNRYRVHQRLCMAFPSSERKDRDRDFLQPYTPDAFAVGHVHTPRSINVGFLFRVDPRPGGGPVVIVQSADRPDWDYAFHNARYLLAAEPEVKNYEPSFQPQNLLRFRLQVNPTRRACKSSRGHDGRILGPKWTGKRIPVPPEALEGWLTRRAERAGFQLIGLAKVLPGYVYFNKSGKSGAGQRLCSVVYEGQLRVIRPDAFVETLQAGIGSAKAFGFGLLSVARAGQ